LSSGHPARALRPNLALTRELGPRELAHFQLPQFDDPDEQLNLQVRFTYASTSDAPEVVVKCQGLILKVYRLPRLWSVLQRLVRRPIKRRRRLVVQVPAALFMMRRITRIGIAPGANTKITVIELRWLRTKRWPSWWGKIGPPPMRRIGALDT
jgi:hypothetical protein